MERLRLPRGGRERPQGHGSSTLHARGSPPHPPLPPAAPASPTVLTAHGLRPADVQACAVGSLVTREMRSSSREKPKAPASVTVIPEKIQQAALQSPSPALIQEPLQARASKPLSTRRGPGVSRALPAGSQTWGHTSPLYLLGCSALRARTHIVTSWPRRP